MHVLESKMRPHRQRDRAVADARRTGILNIAPAVFVAIVGHARNRLRIIYAGAPTSRVGDRDDDGALTRQLLRKDNRQAVPAVLKAPAPGRQQFNARYAGEVTF